MDLSHIICVIHVFLDPGQPTPPTEASHFADTVKMRHKSTKALLAGFTKDYFSDSFRNTPKASESFAIGQASI